MAGWPDGRMAGWPGDRVAGWPGGRAHKKSIVLPHTLTEKNMEISTKKMQPSNCLK